MSKRENNAEESAARAHQSDSFLHRGTSDTGRDATTSGNSSASMSHLLKLSQGCENHKAWHDSSKNRAVATSANDSDTIPEKCRKELRKIRTLLPKVEAGHLERCFSGSGSSSSSLSQQIAADAIHLCAFYRSVMSGGFCPHAAVLFDDGRGGVECKLEE